MSVNKGMQGKNMNSNMADKKSISIIIPVFNEESAIRHTLTTLQHTLRNSAIEAFEILVVNDGSSDNTAREIRESKVPCRVITHTRNKGYGASIKTGLRHAAYNTIGITDADGTYPHEKLPEMYAQYTQRQLDMLVGSRTGEHVAYPFIKKIPKFFIIALANYIADTKIPDINSGLRIFDKHIALQFFNIYPNGFSFTITITMGMLCRGYEVAYFPIDYYARQGKSKISPIKDTAGFFRLLGRIAVFFNPLKFFLPFVAFLTLISIGVFIRDIFIAFNLSQSAVLFPILAILVFFMGMIADMIARKL
jgi:glycosyltransferase involved in cell wall biosynthesis